MLRFSGCRRNPKIRSVRAAYNYYNLHVYSRQLRKMVTAMTLHMPISDVKKNGELVAGFVGSRV